MHAVLIVGGMGGVLIPNPEWEHAVTTILGLGSRPSRDAVTKTMSDHGFVQILESGIRVVAEAENPTLGWLRPRVAELTMASGGPTPEPQKA